MKQTTLPLERVGVVEADPFSAALWSFTSRMDAALRKDEKTYLKATAPKPELARQIKANSLNPSIRTH